MGESANLGRDPHAHIPVLLHEVLAGLAVAPGGRYLDGTVGGGGHAAAILEASAPDGHLLGLDRDPEAVARAAARLAPFGSRVRLEHASYTRLLEVAESAGWLPLDGVLLDLGFSSWQIDDPARGFSFRLEGLLDMRFDQQSAEPSAADLVNTLDVTALADVLYHYGEERRSRRIARAIVAARPIHTTGRLAEVVLEAVGRRRDEALHPATKTFQALRIAVNRELEAVEQVLPRAISALRPGGRLAVISFHSLEDRRVKQHFRRESRACVCPPEIPICVCQHKPVVRQLHRKPVSPSEAELRANPRSRSARLRIVEKLSENSTESTLKNPIF